MNKTGATLLLCALALGGCDTQDVPAGYVGIKVYNYGTNKGVDHETLGPGRYKIGINEQLFLFPTFEQNPKYKNDTDGVKDEAGAPLSFQTKEGLEVEGDFSVTYFIEADNADDVFQRYRAGIEEINRGPLRNMLRDALNETASAMGIEDVYGSGKVAMLSQVQDVVVRRAKERGLTVTQVAFLGAVRFPPTITEALNAKIAATQKAQQRQNELAEAQAEAAKKVAAAKGDAESVLLAAKAQAEANRTLAQSLSPAVLEYQRLQISGATPFIQVPTKE